MKSYSEWVKDTNPGNYVSVDVTGLPLQLVAALPGQTNDKPHITLMYSMNSAVPFEHVAYVLKRKNIIGAVVHECHSAWDALPSEQCIPASA